MADSASSAESDAKLASDDDKNPSATALRSVRPVPRKPANLAGDAAAAESAARRAPPRAARAGRRARRRL